MDANLVVFAGEVGTCEPEKPNDYSAPLTKARFGKIRNEERGFGVFCTIFQGTSFCVKVRLPSTKGVTTIQHLPPKAFFEKKMKIS